jgi:hypothetical protein
MNLRVLIHMVLFAVLATGVYLVKYSVQDVQRELAALKTNLATEKESLHLLSAEWAYLNRPDRLRQLADRHLDLVPLDSRQIDRVSVLPAAYTGDASPRLSPMVREVSSTSEGH